MDFQTIIIMRLLWCSDQSPSSRPEESLPYELNGRENELALNTGLGVFHGAFGIWFAEWISKLSSSQDFCDAVTNHPHPKKKNHNTWRTKWKGKELSLNTVFLR
jgi:hypothetical protein